MENRYWIGRKRSAMAMARDAATAEARLIHFDLAGRYSIMAAQCLPFAVRVALPAAPAERAALSLPEAGAAPVTQRRPPVAGDPS